MSQVVLDPSTSDTSLGDGGWMVVIYNNTTNSMDEVLLILMHATGCDEQEAFMEMWEAHTFGKAPVHFSGKSDCESVAAIVSSIGVRTDVVPEWVD